MRPFVRRLTLSALTAATVLSLAVSPAHAQDEEGEETEAPQPAAPCSTIAHIGDDMTIGMGQSQLEETYTHYLAAERVLVDANDRRDFEGAVEAIGHMKDELGDDDGVCWVIDVGTHDAAAVRSGDGERAGRRIDAILGAISGEDPVFWVDPITSHDAEGGYRDAAMVAWLETLSAAAAVDPAMSILGWGAEVAEHRYKYMLDDGIHYTSAGYTDRADFIGWRVGQFVYGS